MYTQRHREVLGVAMELIAERGLKAASLRELARRLDISQPSLYHYFRSKEELIEQILDAYTREILVIPPSIPEPADVATLVRLALETLVALYERPEHAHFVRFMFAVTMERPRFGGALRSHFLQRGIELMRPLFRLFIERGDIAAADVEPTIRVSLNALALRLIEEHVLFAVPDDADTHAYVDFVADVIARGVSARAKAARAVLAGGGR